MKPKHSYRIALVFRTSILVGICVFVNTAIFAQNGRGTVSGRAVDRVGAVLDGARVKLEPGDFVTASDGQGEFNLIGVAPGKYTLTISYVGFTTYTKEVTVIAGQASRIDASLAVSAKSEEVSVVADRPHGEAEAINRQRTSDNILQVLPSDVITSLPNANIADAVGRLPSVTLERDEGEGKYVQIRGTEPRLNAVTIDGILVPAPEDNVRQVKLDTIPADIVESVEVNKTLSANQDAEAIGGSVNLVTKTAGDQPTLSLGVIGGFTPILNTRAIAQVSGTVGQRFGVGKKFGALSPAALTITAAASTTSNRAPTTRSSPAMAAWISVSTDTDVNAMVLGVVSIINSATEPAFTSTTSTPISEISATSGCTP